MLHDRPLTVSEVARRYGCRPRDISDLFYLRLLDDQVAPIVGNRRIIPVDYLPVVERVLRERGLLPSEPEAATS